MKRKEHVRDPEPREWMQTTESDMPSMKRSCVRSTSFFLLTTSFSISDCVTQDKFITRFVVLSLCRQLCCCCCCCWKSLSTTSCNTWGKRRKRNIFTVHTNFLVSIKTECRNRIACFTASLHTTQKRVIRFWRKMTLPGETTRVLAITCLFVPNWPPVRVVSPCNRRPKALFATRGVSHANSIAAAFSTTRQTCLKLRLSRCMKVGFWLSGSQKLPIGVPNLVGQSRFWSSWNPTELEKVKGVSAGSHWEARTTFGASCKHECYA